MECCGNLFDAVSMAVKAALFSTVIPRVTVTAVDGGEPELEVSEIHSVFYIDSNNFPVYLLMFSFLLQKRDLQVFILFLKNFN